VSSPPRSSARDPSSTPPANTGASSVLATVRRLNERDHDHQHDKDHRNRNRVPGAATRGANPRSTTRCATSGHHGRGRSQWAGAGRRQVIHGEWTGTFDDSTVTRSHVAASRGRRSRARVPARGLHAAEISSPSAMPPALRTGFAERSGRVATYHVSAAFRGRRCSRTKQQARHRGLSAIRVDADKR
jgi:hypothetical protein